MSQEFMTDEQMEAAHQEAPEQQVGVDPSDMDPQSAAAMPGMKKLVSAAVDDTKNAPGDDSIQPDYNSPIETIGFAAPKAAMSASEAIANGLKHTDFAKLVGNEIGTLGKPQASGVSLPKNGAIQRISSSLGLPEGASIDQIREAAKGATLSESDKAVLNRNIGNKAKRDLSITTGERNFAEGGEVSSPEFLTDEQMNNASSQEDKYGTTAQQAITGLEGVAKGFAGPLVPLAEQAANKAIFNQPEETTNENIRGREEANPILSKAAEAAGFGASMYSGIGEAASVAKAANLAVKGFKGTSMAAKVGSAVVRGAIENAALQSGDEAAKMIVKDPRQSADTAIANIGLAGVLGGSLGGAFEGASHLLNKSTGKLGQTLQDFRGRLNEHMDNPDPQAALTKELSDHYGNIKSVADDVYGPQGLKAADIEKSMPEMSPKMTEQSQSIAGKLGETLEHMSSKESRFPTRLTSRLSEDLENYTAGISGAKSPAELFNATQDLKQTLQDYAKYDKFVKPTDDAYDFVKEAKKLAYDLRTSLEDKSVWGKAAERQQTINKAFTEFQPALKDFEKKFTSEELGERVIDPGKVSTYLNQIGKPSAEIKQSMLENFLKASSKYSKVIGDSHANLGIESPIQHTPLTVANSTLNKSTLGSKLADYLVNKGVGQAGGKTLGAAAGALGAHYLGLSPELGALVGTHALGNFFSTTLPSLTKSILKMGSHPEAFADAANYAASVAKGEKLVDKAVTNLFTDKEVLPPSAVPSDKNVAKLDKILQSLQVSANGLMGVGSHVGHYLPDHGLALAQTANNAVQFLNSQRPNNQTHLPLDEKQPIAPYQEKEYQELLRLAEQPMISLQKMKKGTLTMQDVSLVKTLYPALYGSINQKIMNHIITAKSKNKLIPYNSKMGISLFMGQPMDSTMQYMAIIGAQTALQSKLGQPMQGASQGAQKPPAAASMKPIQGQAAQSRTPSQTRQYNQQTKD